MTMNIGGFLSKRAALSPAREALVLGDLRLTWQQLNRRCNRFANAVSALGVKAGDRVAFLGLNEAEFFDLYFGLGKIGAIMVPINHRLAGPEVSYIVNDCQAKALIYSPEFAPVVESIRSDLPCEHLVALSDDPAGGARSYKSVTEGAADTEPEITAGGDDTLTILYTSGTTGRPKGAELTHNGYFGTSVTCGPRSGISARTCSCPCRCFTSAGWHPCPCACISA